MADRSPLCFSVANLSFISLAGKYQNYIYPLNSSTGISSPATFSIQKPPCAILPLIQPARLPVFVSRMKNCSIPVLSVIHCPRLLKQASFPRLGKLAG
jgi:hypothetical protein